MPDIPAAQGPRPARPAAQPLGSQPPAPARPQESPTPGPAPAKRQVLKTIMAPLVLGVLGLALLLAAFKLYPSPADLPAPATTRVDIELTSLHQGAPPLSFIYYQVGQVSPGVARLQIQVTLAGRRSAGAGVGLLVALPAGTPLMYCRPACIGHTGSVVQLFTSGQVTADFLVKARDFGVAANGVIASAAIPEINYIKGKGAPILVTGYELPSASSYDWSSYPAAQLGSSFAIWHETVTAGITSGRIATGVNNVAQANDDHRTFFAGALLGLAGGALLSAVQEALHARD